MLAGVYHRHVFRHVENAMVLRWYQCINNSIFSRRNDLNNYIFFIQVAIRDMVLQ